MIRRWCMTGFGLGYCPVASGTAGSAGAVAIGLLFWVGQSSRGLPAVSLDIAWVALAIVAIIGCAAWGRWAVEYYASRSRKPGDPGQVVLDEFAGQWVAMIALPLAGLDRPVAALAVFAVQFFLFRVFDVLKLPPARQLEKLPAGWGIVMDDVAAGVQANLVGQILFRAILHL